jgi:hypothetical protein
VTRFVIEARDHTAGIVASIEAPPGGGFALGQFAQSGLLRFEATGFDADDEIRVRGRSLAVLPSALVAEVLPLFAQRIDRFSRPPGRLPTPIADARLTAISSRYMMLAPSRASSAPRAWFYDLAALDFGGPLALPHAARSVATHDLAHAALIIDDEAASWIDFAAGEFVSLALPAGLAAWSDVAGGQTVQADDGHYIVGATRADVASDVVLVVRDDRSIEVARLQNKRQGAAAAWLSGHGLVVAAGHPSAAGVEILRAGASQSETLPYPADDSRGASLTPSATQGQLIMIGGTLAGGGAATREIAVACQTMCGPVVIEPRIDPPLSDTRAFWIGASQVFVSGHDSAGFRQSFAVRLGEDAVLRPLREPRIGSDIAPGPDGALFVAGGHSSDGEAVGTIERLWIE